MAGNQPRRTPMTYCSTTPDTNSGIDALARPSVTMDRSSGSVLLAGRHNAPDDTDRNGQHQREGHELGRRPQRGKIRSRTWASSSNEFPKSKVTVPTQQVTELHEGGIVEAEAVVDVHPGLLGRKRPREDAELDRRKDRVRKNTTMINMSSVTSDSATAVSGSAHRWRFLRWNVTVRSRRRRAHTRRRRCGRLRTRSGLAPPRIV